MHFRASFQSEENHRFCGIPVVGDVRSMILEEAVWLEGKSRGAMFNRLIHLPSFRSQSDTTTPWIVALVVLAFNLLLLPTSLHSMYIWLMRIAAPALLAAVLKLRRDVMLARDALAKAAERDRELRRTNQELAHMVSVDPMTGVGNRRCFEQSLEREHARMLRDASSLSLILIDVDYFKFLNDSQGHQRGDEYLVKVAEELRSCAMRPADVVSRIGGEEFALILPETDESGVLVIAERARRAVSDLRLTHFASPVGPFLTISLGVVTSTSGNMKELIAAADRALYAAKHAGRNRVASYGSLQPSNDPFGEKMPSRPSDRPVLERSSS